MHISSHQPSSYTVTKLVQQNGQQEKGAQKNEIKGYAYYVSSYSTQHLNHQKHWKQNWQQDHKIVRPTPSQLKSKSRYSFDSDRCSWFCKCHALNPFTGNITFLLSYIHRSLNPQMAKILSHIDSYRLTGQTEQCQWNVLHRETVLQIMQHLSPNISSILPTPAKT